MRCSPSFLLSHILATWALSRAECPSGYGIYGLIQDFTLLYGLTPKSEVNFNVSTPRIGTFFDSLPGWWPVDCTAHDHQRSSFFRSCPLGYRTSRMWLIIPVISATCFMYINSRTPYEIMSQSFNLSNIIIQSSTTTQQGGHLSILYQCRFAGIPMPSGIRLQEVYAAV